MTVTVGGTSITFNDATTQTTAPVNTNANVNSISAGTGISVSSSTGAITITNTAAAYTGPRSQVFASSGTFTVPSGISWVKVTCIGGGGGSGSATKGGQGGWAIGGYNVTPGAGISVTVGGGGGLNGGSGGSSSFGGYCSATGGSGGAGNLGRIGVGSGGTITNSANVSVFGAPVAGAVVSTIGLFTGYSYNLISDAQDRGASAWTTTQGSLPGAAGFVISITCSAYASGGIGGAVLVEW